MKLYLIGLIILCSALAFVSYHENGITGKICYPLNLICIGFNVRGLLEEFKDKK